MNDFYPLVSIIIPVYNGSEYMQEAIDSALAQTYQNTEVLVINDGSTDGGETDTIAKAYGNRIRYIAKENGGVSSALNTGIQNMRGEYFSWLSHDDVYTPDKVEKSVAALRELERKDTVLFCGSMHIDSHSNPLFRIAEHNVKVPTLVAWEDALMGLLKNGSMNGCAFLIRKDVFEICGLFDEKLRFNQDGFMWTKMFLKEYPLYCIPDICVKNRIHSKQLTQTGQAVFHRDCDRMSNVLIPKLLQISTKERNYILEYIRYNAKYKNFSVVRQACRSAKVLNLISVGQIGTVVIRCVYGLIRPVIRKIYYALFRRIRTT